MCFGFEAKAHTRLKRVIPGSEPTAIAEDNTLQFPVQSWNNVHAFAY